MSQTHRQTWVKEAKRKRRNYLLQKACVLTYSAMAVAMGVGASLVYLSLLAGTASTAFGDIPFLSKVVAVVLVVVGGTSWTAVTIWKSTANDRASPAYVPPVREQIARLPAEEVLLRGSDQPVATPEELLRAAKAGNAEPAEELLHSVPTQSTLE